MNKTEFYSLISEELLASVELSDGKQLFETVRDKCKCNQDVDLDACLPKQQHMQFHARPFVHWEGFFRLGLHKDTDDYALFCCIKSYYLLSSCSFSWVWFICGSFFSVVVSVYYLYKGPQCYYFKWVHPVAGSCSYFGGSCSYFGGSCSSLSLYGSLFRPKRLTERSVYVWTRMMVNF